MKGEASGRNGRREERGELADSQGALRKEPGELEKGRKRSERRHTWWGWTSWVENSNEHQSFLLCFVSCESLRALRVGLSLVWLNQTPLTERRVLLELREINLVWLIVSQAQHTHTSETGTDSKEQHFIIRERAAFEIVFRLSPRRIHVKSAEVLTPKDFLKQLQGSSN